MPCENCTWYAIETEYHSGEDQDGLGECRANPPTPATNPLHRGIWPRVKRTDYCRLFVDWKHGTK